MQAIRTATKRYEYRRVYRKERTRAVIYENAPSAPARPCSSSTSRSSAPPAELARIADGVHAGHGASVLAYMRGLDIGFAVPIRAWEDIDPIDVHELRCVHPRFAAPQSYILLDRCPPLRDLMLERRCRGGR